LEQFASIVAHDLRPLLSLAGCSQLLMEETEGLGEDARELAGTSGSAHCMARLIDSLLDYSRIGQGGLKRTQCSLEHVLSEVLSNVRSALEASGGQVTHHPLPEVEADPTLLAQLLQNLIENGIKYRDEASPRIHISAHETPAEWVISVADNGIGIDPKYSDKIFQIFQRLHRNESKYPGVGRPCKKIVEHGGRMGWNRSLTGLRSHSACRVNERPALWGPDDSCGGLDWSFDSSLHRGSGVAIR
jgi:light-regulated signal transduction histidine kinase (bacteriophytochrome)